MTDPMHHDGRVATDTTEDKSPALQSINRRARGFDVQFALLQSRILEAGTCVDAMIVLSVEALINKDSLRAREVLRWVETIEQLELDIESQCLQLTIRERPVGSHLRSAGTVLKVITELERIGNHAAKIAGIPEESAHPAEYHSYSLELSRLVQLNRSMLENTLQAFVRMDLLLANDVLAAAHALHGLSAEIRRSIMVDVSETLRSPEWGYSAMCATDRLEQIGEHTINIAERVAFNITGNFRRHNDGSNMSNVTTC